MTTYSMSDAAYYTASMLSGFQAVAGYIGGSNAAHTWSDADWTATSTVPKLPIWVPSASATAAEARSEVLDILNVILHYNMPRGQTIAFDLETSEADSAYMKAMAGYLEFFGYGTIAYGSLSTIGQAVPGYLWKWDADWTGSSHLTAGMMATQWTNGQAYDQSVISEELYQTLLWR